MKNTEKIVLFISILLMLVYCGIVGLILIDGNYDFVSILIITVSMFILVGCLYKITYEHKIK